MHVTVVFAIQLTSANIYPFHTAWQVTVNWLILQMIYCW